MEPKSILKSKTFWVNLISLAAIVAQAVTGKEIIPVELQTVLLAAINIALRTITGQPVQWIILALLAPAFLLTSCASFPANTTKYSSASRDIGRDDPLPEKIATGADGAVLFDKDNVALTEHKDQVIWRFRQKGRDDDNLEHWTRGVFEALGQGFTAMTAFSGEPFAAAALAASMNGTIFPSIFADTVISDYEVASDIEIRASGDDLTAVVTKSMSNDIKSSDLKQASGKAVTDFDNGPFITIAIFGDLNDQAQKLIDGVLAIDLEKETEPTE